MPKEGFTHEVLKVCVLNPAGDNGFIGHAMQILQIHQTRKQSRRCRRTPGFRRKETGLFLLEELPIDRRRQLHQLVAHIDHVNEARAQKIILFRQAVTMFHGRIKLQGFQCNGTKPCNS